MQQHSDGQELSRGNDNQGSQDVVKVSEIQALLTQLPGIIAARLMVNDWGAIDAIHILATTERGAKQLVRDVESCLAARWGINIDHKKISIARVESSAPVLESVGLRLGQVVVNMDTVASRCNVKVTLRLDTDDDIEFIGGASGTTIIAEQPRIVAMATLDALNQVIRPDRQLICEDARLIHITGRQLAVVVFSFYGPQGYYQLLSGSSPVLGDPVESMIQACLQGADRFVRTSLTAGEQTREGG